MTVGEEEGARELRMSPNKYNFHIKQNEQKKFWIKPLTSKELKL